MAEEVENAEVNVPRSMVISVTVNGVLAFTLTFVLLYFGGSIDALVASPVQYPWLLIIQNATGSKTAMVVTGAVHIFMAFAGSVSALAAGSRMLWSFARDRGLPLSRFISKVRLTSKELFSASNKTMVDRSASHPDVCYCRSRGAFCLHMLHPDWLVRYFFEIFISLVVVGFVSSYLVVLLALLYRRLRGDIKEPDEDVVKDGNKHSIKCNVQTVATRDNNGKDV